MAIKRIYFNLPLDTLMSMQASTLAAIEKVKNAQTVSGGEISISLPSLEYLQNDLAEINAAIDYAKNKYSSVKIGRLSNNE